MKKGIEKVPQIKNKSGYPVMWQDKEYHFSEKALKIIDFPDISRIIKDFLQIYCKIYPQEDSNCTTIPMIRYPKLNKQLILVKTGIPQNSIKETKLPTIKIRNLNQIRTNVNNSLVLPSEPTTNIKIPENATFLMKRSLETPIQVDENYNASSLNTQRGNQNKKSRTILADYLSSKIRSSRKLILNLIKDNKTPVSTKTNVKNNSIFLSK